MRIRELDKKWEVQVHLLFWRAIERSILEILELESEQMGVTSPEGKEFSPDCEVETEIKDDGGTMKVRLVDFGLFFIFKRQGVLICNV